MSEFTRYVASGEINSRVEDAQTTIEKIASAFGDREQDRLDGLTVDLDGGWFNVRPSNTEPLLRLNVEGADEATMAAIRDQVLALIRA
jgi:phosphomannomutase